MLTYFLIMLLTLFLFSYYLINTMAVYMRSSEKQRVVRMTESISDFAKGHFYGSKKAFKADMEPFVSGLKSDSDVIITIFDSAGISIYTKGSGMPLNQSKTVKKALNGEKGFARYKNEKGVFVLDCSRPIVSDGEVMGAVNVLYSSNEIPSFVNNIVNDSLLLTVLISLLVGVIIFVVANLMTKRIVEFTNRITSMSRDNRTEKLEIHGNDEISKLGEAFNNLSEKVSVLEKQRTEFVSNASHELKTPLSSIKLMADSIIQTPDISMDYVREFLSDMNDEVERLNRIVNKLLYITKLDTLTESMSGSLELINLKDVVSGINKNLMPIAEMEDKELVLSAEEDILIMANKDILWQAIYNIVDNALKYTKEYGRVEVSLVKESKRAVITVKDNGVGMASEDLERIFDRFYRVDKARSRDTGGTGLGLSIAQSAIEFHNGSIEVSSELNVGSEFRIILPLVEWL